MTFQKLFENMINFPLGGFAMKGTITDIFSDENHIFQYEMCQLVKTRELENGQISQAIKSTWYQEDNTLVMAKLVISNYHIMVALYLL